MYVMIILTWLSGYANAATGPTATTQQFTSQQSCEAARQALLDHYYWWAPHNTSALTAVCVAE